MTHTGALDVPELTHVDCGQPLTINLAAGPDPDQDARNLFYCRHCGDGQPHRQDADCGCGFCYDANDL